MENPWTTLSKRKTYSNAWIEVVEHQVLNPSGNPGIYGVVQFRNRAVGVIPIDEDGYTWLVGQYRFPHDTYEWEIPEGGCLDGETVESAAKRELLEEVGLEAKEWEVLMANVQVSNSTTNELGYAFVARGITQHEPNPEDCEQLAIRRLPVEEAIKMAMNGEIRDLISVAALLKLKILLG